MEEPNKNISELSEGSVSSPMPKKGMNVRSRVFWAVFSLFLAAATVFTVCAQNAEFTEAGFLEYLSDVSLPMLAVAILCMLGYVFFEGAALSCIVRAFGFPAKKRQGFIYAASDIYFSAITPSSSGGQPASAYFMLKDGIPASVIAVSLLVNLIMYNLSILIIGIFTFVFCPSVFFSLSLWGKIMVVFGYVLLCGLTFLICLLLKRGKIVFVVADAALRFLGKIHLLRHVDRKRKKLRHSLDDYNRYASMIFGHGKMLVRSFFLNLAQRSLILLVSSFTYLAVGGSLANFGNLFCSQAYVVIGSGCLPVPGAMGAADYLMLNTFGQFMEHTQAVNLELLARSVSFYACVVLCGLSVLITFIFQKRRKRK